jgi:hypothetical protein
MLLQNVFIPFVGATVPGMKHEHRTGKSGEPAGWKACPTGFIKWEIFCEK